MAITGVDILVKVNTGTELSPVLTTIGGQKNASLKRTTNEIDVSDKTTGGFEKSLAGLKKWSIDLDSNFEEEDNGLAKLEEIWDNRGTVLIVFETPTGRQYKGLAIVASLNIDGPHTGAASLSATLSGAGELEKINF